jgi:glycosyltransferase involved in cell wall biosynthesis
VRIAFGADQLWSPVPGGIGTYVRELAPALAQAGADLSLYHCRFRGGGPEADWLARFPLVEVPGPMRTLWPQWALLGRPKLPPVFEGFDVVHATNPAGVPPVRRGSRLVVTIHDLAFERYPERFPLRWRLLYGAGVRAAGRRADAILTPSQATADDLRELIQIDAAKVHVTPLAAAPPVDTDARQDGAEPEDPPSVLFVGTMEPRKNVVTLVRAYRQVAPDVPHELMLVGPRGWQAEEIDEELARPGAGEVVLTGRLDEGALDAAYRRASVFVYPSAYEGFGLPVLEAMARGVPVITTSTPALEEVAGEAALLVEPGDVAGLADAIARVLGDPGLAARMAERGRDRAAAYSWAATARATLDVYRLIGGAAS